MSAHVLLKLLKELGKNASLTFYLCFLMSLIKSIIQELNSSFYLSYDPKTTLKLRFLHENAKILPKIHNVITAIDAMLPKSVNHKCFIDFNTWHYITCRCDVI